MRIFGRELSNKSMHVCVPGSHLAFLCNLVHGDYEFGVLYVFMPHMLYLSHKKGYDIKGT